MHFVCSCGDIHPSHMVVKSVLSHKAVVWLPLEKNSQEREKTNLGKNHYKGNSIPSKDKLIFLRE